MNISKNKIVKVCKDILYSLLGVCLLVWIFYYFSREIQHIFISPYIIDSMVTSGFYDENKILLNGAIYSGLVSALSCVAVILIVRENWIKILSYLMLFTSCFFLLFPICSFIQNKSTDGLKERASLIYSQNVLAFRTYIHETKYLPLRLEDVISALPEIRLERNDIAIERLNYRLTEPYSGKTNIVQEFDGTGGWVYNPAQGIFGLNVKGMEQYTTNLTSYLEEVQKKTENGKPTCLVNNLSPNMLVETEDPLERVLRGIDRTDAHLFLSSKNIRSFEKRVDTESQNYRRMMRIVESNKEMRDYMRLTNELFSLGTDVLYSYITNELVSFRASFPEGTDENPDNIRKISRLKKIYDLMGTNLVSLIPFYESNLETNCNFVCAIYGLTALSQAGVPSLIKALTNHSSALQEMGMTGVVMAGWDAVTYYDETINTDIAKKVLPLLIPYLHHPSEEVRMQVMTGLQIYCTAPEESIPPLLECALTDSDDLVKARAIRSVLGILKRFEVSDPKVVDTITHIANDEQQHEDLRNAMKFFLTQMQNDMSGTNSSQKVQGE